MSARVSIWTPAKLAEARNLRASMTWAQAAEHMHVSCASLRMALRDSRGRPGADAPLVVEAPPPEVEPVEDLIERRCRQFNAKRKHEDARKLITVRVPSDLPIGILHFGDPHLDDDGTDLALLREHAALVRRVPGLYGATPGDSTNNWIGRLARIWAEQGTTAADSWRLAEWFIAEVKHWLYIVGGNHDLWSGAGDPLKWIADQAGALYQASEVRIALRFPNDREVRINCRHDFAGKSIYNPAFGVMKALTWGIRDHVAICGHWHVSGYGILKDPDTGIAMHGIQVGSYKTYDRLARERGFRDQMLGPACVTVIDPRLPPQHPGLVKVFWDPAEGAEFLGWIRGRKQAAA